MNVIDMQAIVITSESIKSVWQRMKSTTQNVCTQSVKWTKETAGPAVVKGIDVTLTKVDAGCGVLNNNAVAFLRKYPNIAATLSPQTVVRMAVAEHYKVTNISVDHHVEEDAVDSVMTAEVMAVSITQ